MKWIKKMKFVSVFELSTVAKNTKNSTCCMYFSSQINFNTFDEKGAADTLSDSLFHFLEISWEFIENDVFVWIKMLIMDCNESVGCYRISNAMFIFRILFSDSKVKTFLIWPFCNIFVSQFLFFVIIFFCF